MNHKKAVTIGVLALAIGGGAATAQASEQSQIQFASGAFAINPTTCKFLHREVDKPLGNSWTVGRVAFAYEDGRHDALDTCLRNKVNNAPKLPKPDTCFAQNGPVPVTAEAPADKQGYHDTQGLNALRAWVSKLAACEAAR